MAVSASPSLDHGTPPPRVRPARRRLAALCCAVAVVLTGCQAASEQPSDRTPRSTAGVTAPGASELARPGDPRSTPGPGSTAQPGVTPATGGSAAIPRPAHVVVVVLENKPYSKVIGPAPYLTSLARRGANFTASFGVRYPSQPNYLALFSGSTQGVTDNTCPLLFPTAPNLARQLLDAGHSFTGYAEGLPRPGFTGCVASDGRYARKHVPWVNFGTVPASVSLPFSAFPRDYTALPTVSFVVPDLCSDMHDCPVSRGDAWLRDNLDGYARWAMTHDSVLIVTFDEDDHSEGNRIPTVIVGQRVKPGNYHRRIDHYTVLRTIEEMYGLPPLGRAATRQPLTEIWR